MIQCQVFHHAPLEKEGGVVIPCPVPVLYMLERAMALKNGKFMRLDEIDYTCSQNNLNKRTSNLSCVSNVISLIFVFLKEAKS